MQLQILCVVALSLSVAAIRVPVDGTEEQPRPDVVEELRDPGSQEPVYYTSNEDNIDSYLFTPDPHKTEEILNTPDSGTTNPASHLVPPSQEKQDINYYIHSPSKIDQHEHTDWLPITQIPELKKSQDKDAGEKIFDYLGVNNPERKKIVIQSPEPESPPNKNDILVVKKPKYPGFIPLQNEFLGLPVPSQQLEPPSVGAVDEYALALPLKNSFPLATKPIRLTPPPPAKIVFDPNLQKKVALNFDHSGNLPRISLDLIPPKLQNLQRIPTARYPKKYTPFQIVPIPIGPFSEIPDSPEVRPLGNFITLGEKFVGRKHHGIFKGNKPVKPFQPYTSNNLPTPDELKINLYQQLEEERNPKDNSDKTEESVTQINEEQVTPEQITSETNFDHGGNRHQTLVKIKGKSGAYEAAATPPNERTEFRMHGMKGPHSYQFGYDTGKGKNRQFRYEERDNDGHVRGHYGYMDKHGKLRVVNYDADPKLGFRAEAPTDAEQ